MLVCHASYPFNSDFVFCHFLCLDIMFFLLVKLLLICGNYLRIPDSLQFVYKHCYSCVFGKRNYRVLIRVCVCVFLHHNSKRNRSRNTKFEHIVVYENSSDEFDIEQCPIKVKVTVGVQKYSPFTTILSGPIVQLWYKLGTLY